MPLFYHLTKYECKSVLCLDTFLSFMYVIIFKKTPVWGMRLVLDTFATCKRGGAILSVSGDRQNSEWA